MDEAKPLEEASQEAEATVESEEQCTKAEAQADQDKVDNEDVIDIGEGDKDGDTFKEGDGEVDNDTSTHSESNKPTEDPETPSPNKYRIPKLSERQDSSEAEGKEAGEQEDQTSDTELLVDETMDDQPEAPTEKEDEKDEKENDTNEKEETGESSKPKEDKGDDKEEEIENEDADDKHKRRHRGRSRSKSRDKSRSRSRSRDRRRRGRSRDRLEVVTNSLSPEMIRSRVFVGHLNTDKADKEDVERLFSPYGHIIGITLNKGYGFVQYDNEKSAKAAIREVHGTPFHGSTIVVDKTVALKKMIGEDPKSEPPLPREPMSRRRERAYYDDEVDYVRRRDIYSRYSRLEELERYLYDRDRYDRFGPPRSRDPYYDSYYDRPPPPSHMDYDRPRYSEMDRERDRYPPRERERYPPAGAYPERRRDDYDDYGTRPPPVHDDGYGHYPSRRY